MLDVVMTVCLLVSAVKSTAFLKVQAEPGEDATLKCVGASSGAVEVVKWTRPDLMSEYYVFFYRDDKPNRDYQHLLYTGRVDLRDPDMKEGDVSVVLRNVSSNDTGRYQCEVSLSRGRRKRAHSDLWCSIDLRVEAESGLEGSWYGRNAVLLHQLMYVSIVTVVVLAAAALVYAQVKKQIRTQISH